MSEDRLPFSMMPIEAFFDARLTLVQLRVLGALLSFRNRSTGLIYPSREAIAARTGLPITRISTATTALVELGWLSKDGRGGRACHYAVTTPTTLTEALARRIQDEPTVTESVTVTDSVTVTESVTDTVTESVTVEAPTVTESVTDTVTESVTLNRPTNRPEERTDKRTDKRATARASLDMSGLPADLSPEIWTDYLAHRKAIKAPLTTQTALNGIVRELEAGRAMGYTPDVMIATAIERNWRGIKADWVRQHCGTTPHAGAGRKSPISSEDFANKTYCTTDATSIDWL